MAVRDTRRRSSLLKNVYLSHDLNLFRVKALEKGLCTVQTITPLDTKSKFQMLPLFSGRHISAPQMCTNMAFPYWAL